MGAERTSNALDDSEINLLFEPLAAYDHLALAVSGGSDSTALMVLAGRWKQWAAAALRLSVLTVDHGLRAQSTAEADQVAAWASEVGLAHQTLRWRGKRPASGLQDAAREARYGLMSQWCTSNGAQAIVTAHTMDDQAETFMMRLARGSGVDGLSGMAEESHAPWRVLRPLLGVPRARLQASLRRDGHGWIEDPSNQDCNFERIKVRKVLNVLRSLELGPVPIALSAKRLSRARTALEHFTAELRERAVSVDANGKVLLDLAMLRAVPDELQIRLLHDTIRQVSGRTFLRLAAVERLAEWINLGTGQARTLGGCRVSRRKRSIVVAAEPGRKPD